MRKLYVIFLVMTFLALFCAGLTVYFTDAAGPRMCVDSMDDTSGCDYISVKHLATYFSYLGYNEQSNGGLGIFYLIAGAPYLRESTYEILRQSLLPGAILWGVLLSSSLFLGQAKVQRFSRILDIFSVFALLAAGVWGASALFFETYWSVGWGERIDCSIISLSVGSRYPCNQYAFGFFTFKQVEMGALITVLTLVAVSFAAVWLLLSRRKRV